ncbi:MAG: TPM domain-containing protein [Chitinophagaceae bacterium]|nr:TPM domain-containing protein [Chitinophagaceae bacterium]
MMRRAVIPGILLLLAISSCAQGDTVAKKKLEDLIPPKPIGWTSDFAGLFTGAQVAYLDSLLAKHEKETSHEIAIVTLQLDSVYFPSVKEFEKFSLALFTKWGIGKKDKNNGLAILISPSLRKARIETGYGLEEKLTDQEARIIMDTIIIPAFKKGEYFTGLVAALRSIIKEIG